MKLGMGLHPEKWTDEHLAMARQLGCETVIAWVPFGAGDGVWYAEDFARLVAQAKKHGLVLEGVENPHPQHIDHIVLDEPGKDEQMSNLQKTLANMGETGIKLFGYNFSCCGVQGYYSETNNGDGRGAAAIKRFDEAKVDHTPLPSRRFWFNTEIERRSAVDTLPPTTPEQHWARLKYFLEGLCPVAEKYGMKLCAHPDDPPIEYLKGTFRPLTSIEGMRRLMNLVDSPANCLEFCQGTVSTMRGIDVYEAIREFASAGKIGYVHFRNTSGQLPRYSEVFIDDGYVDMPKALAIYKECGFDGTVMPDHTPRLEAKDWWETGMAFALGYIRGAMQTLACACALLCAATAFGGPKAPENWQPKKIMGRDFYAPAGGNIDNWPTNMVYSTVPFASFGWGERLWINDIKWFNTPMTDKFRFKNLPYTVWDVFGSAKIPWNHNRDYFKKFAEKYPDYPYSLYILDSWFPWFMKPRYDCDHKGFEDFRRQYPGFFAFGVLNELDAAWGNGYKATTNKVLLAKMQKLLPPEYEKDAHEKFRWLDTAFDCLESMHFGCREFSCLFSINPKWAFNVAERGARMITCENELFIVGAPWRFGMVHTRGAARQFGIPWCWYSAHLVAGFTRDGKQKNGQWAIPSKQFPKDEPNLGASHSLLKRNNFYGYMCGANMLSWEMREHFMNIVDTNGVRRTTVYDKEFDEMYRLNARGFDRGAVWTPLAVLTSADEQFCRNGFNMKNKDPISQNAFFWTLVPTSSDNLNWYADRRKGEQGCLYNSEFGEICDVLCPDTRQKSDAFLKVLKDYPAAILVGWFHRDRIDTAALVGYVKQGGRLYVTQKHIDDGLVPSKIEGKGKLVVIDDPIPGDFADVMRKGYWGPSGQGAIASGKQQFPVYQKVLREVQRDFMPVTVEGDIQWGVNRTRKGWLVWLMNNKGVTKFQGEDEEVDASATASVKVTLKSSGKSVTRNVPSGKYKCVELYD